MPNPEFLIYRSSAGSGKTQALAAEYLKLVLSGRSHFRNVLAITFTNKAAGEMKERVLKLLRLFSEGIPAETYHRDLIDLIAVSGGVSPEEICRRAGRVHREILHHYSDFSIGTIDSFVHRIIRSFALELNLSFAFDVQLETGEFVQMAVDDLLEGTGSDPELTRTLVYYTRLLLEDDKTVRLDTDLASFARFLTGEESLVPLEKLASAQVDVGMVADRNRKAINETLERWHGIAARGESLIRNSSVGPQYFMYGTKGGVYSFFSDLIRDQSYRRIFHRQTENKRIREFFEEGRSFAKKDAPSGISQALNALAPLVIGIYEELCADIDAHYPLFAARQILQKNLTWLSLSRKIRQQMQVTMNRENLIPIYEFNRLIWNIIRWQPVPFIYERTSERYDHYLIDEFQDTSAMQWHNLLPLIEDSLSRGGVSMVVGDAKQAIYRWRNGDVWQFVRLPEVVDSEGGITLTDRTAALKRYAEHHFLDQNFRSSPEIIRFNNTFFDWLAVRYPDSLKDIFNRQQQKSGGAHPAGAVEVTLIQEELKTNIAQIREKVTEALVQRVQEVLAMPGHPYSPADLCVLVRRNAEAGMVAAALVEAGIPVVSAESFPLQGFPEAVTLRAITGLLLDGTDQIQATVLATRVWQQGLISEVQYTEALAALRNPSGNGMGLWAWASALLGRCGIHRTLEQYRSMPIYEFCEQAIRDFFGAVAFPPAVQHLLDITGAFVRRYGNDLAAFAEHLDKVLPASLPLPETGQAVQIMTIHRSKGLQFPVVFYPFASESTVPPFGSRQLLWVRDVNPNDFYGLPALLLEGGSDLADTPFAGSWQKEQTARLQDLANLVYVAFTRAADLLYVFASPPSRRSSAGEYLYDMLAEFLPASGFCETTDGVIWKYGMPGDASVPVTTSKMPAEKPVENQGWNSREWTARISIRSGYLRDDMDSEVFAPLNRGVLLHAILADLPSLDYLPETLKNFELSGLITSEEKDSMMKELLALLTREQIAPFFAAEAGNRREATLLTPQGRQLRPDRVVQMAGHLAVLDYKTGEPHPSHRKQVETYCQMLRQMGHASVKGYLLYTATATLAEV